MYEEADWRFGTAHMFTTHGVTVAEAMEAIRDPARVVISPDYNSKSSASSRIVGFSPTFDDLLTVIVVREDGSVYGVNGWQANTKDRRIYGSTGGEEDSR